MNLTKCFIVLLSASVVSCAVAPKKQPMLTHYSAEDHVDFTQSGSASTSGQAFLKQAGGGIVTCAGNEVILMPDTPYFKEMISILQSNNLPDIKEKGAYAGVSRKQICDAQGNFYFDKLPSKKWILMTSVNWVVSYEQQGDILIEYIDLTKEQSKKAILTDSNRIGAAR